MKKLLQTNFLKALSWTVAAVAAISVGTFSIWVIHQPKVPAKLMK